MAEDFTRGLFKTLAITRPYHLQIVIGGGWVPFLYYRYLAKNREHTPVLTRDIDFMVGHQVPIVGSQNIDEIFTREAKLTTTYKNLDNPAVIHYEGTIDGVESQHPIRRRRFRRPGTDCRAAACRRLPRFG